MYEDLQTLYCAFYQTYTKGKVISQPDTGASGKVYKTTSTLLMGWDSGDWGSGALSYKTVNPWKSSCSSAETTSSSPGLLQGLILKQYDDDDETVIFEAVVADSWCQMNQWGGCRVDITSGTLNVEKNFVVSFPRDSTAALAQNNYVDVSGSIPVGSVTGLQYWNGAVVITNADKCTDADDATVYWPSFTVSLEGVDDASVKYITNGQGYGYAYVEETGSGCSVPKATVTPDSGVKCEVVPELKLNCMVGGRAEDTVVQVLLDDSEKRFERGKPIHYATNSDTGKEFESCWVSDTKGNAIPLSDETRILYKTYSTVQANSNNINLICYNGWSGCPAWIWDDESKSSGRVGKADWPSHLSDNAQITSAGSCSVKPTGFTFKDIQGSPKATMVWDQDGGGSYFLKSFIINDRGNICSSNKPPTVTFDDGNCDSDPIVSLTCLSGSYTTDLADYRGANRYKYDAFTGILTDKDGNVLLDDTQSYGQYDVFFEETDAVKKDLLCDWDKSQVCSYQYYAKNMDSYTFSVGTSARRVTLTEGKNPLVFSSPISVIYEHNGVDSNDGKNYNGLKNMLSYSGPGSLWGLPQVCFDKSTMKMKYTCNWFTDLQLDALTIPPDNPLEDVVDGSKYYAKTSSLKEYYPQAADDSICIGLDKTDLPKVPSDNLKKPRNALEGYPSLKTMKETYLNNGLPVVVGGVLTNTDVSVK